ncbi:MAG: NUDIX hydrolase [Patescibacteria group bacterium]
MLYTEEPKNFKPKFEVVSCFVELSSQHIRPAGLSISSPSFLKILLLHRNDNKSQGGKWGAPAGKVEKGETLERAMAREAFEETGLTLKESDLKYLRKVYVHHEGYDFVYHMFRLVLSDKPKITLVEKEHQGFCWISPKESLELNLVDDMATCIRMNYQNQI